MGLTRKEIKQDRIRVILTEIYQWAMVYQGYLVGGLVVLVLLMLTVYGWNSYRQGQSLAAQEAFSKAVDLYHAPLRTAGSPAAQTRPGQTAFDSQEERDSSAAEALQAVVDNYSATDILPWAQYYLALIDERAGRADQAAQSLNELSRNARVAEVRNLAAQRLAGQAQQQGRHQDAIIYWKMVLDDTASHFPIQNAILQLARSYEANGELEDALEHFRRLKDEYPTSEQARQAQLRIDALELQLEGAGGESAQQGGQADQEGGTDSPPSG